MSSIRRLDSSSTLTQHHHPSSPRHRSPLRQGKGHYHHYSHAHAFSPHPAHDFLSQSPRYGPLGSPSDPHDFERAPTPGLESLSSVPPSPVHSSAYPDLADPSYRQFSPLPATDRASASRGKTLSRRQPPDSPAGGEPAPKKVKKSKAAGRTERKPAERALLPPADRDVPPAPQVLALPQPAVSPSGGSGQLELEHQARRPQDEQKYPTHIKLVKTKPKSRKSPKVVRQPKSQALDKLVQPSLRPAAGAGTEPDPVLAVQDPSATIGPALEQAQVTDQAEPSLTIGSAYLAPPVPPEANPLSGLSFKRKSKKSTSKSDSSRKRTARNLPPSTVTPARTPRSRSPTLTEPTSRRHEAIAEYQGDSCEVEASKAGRLSPPCEPNEAPVPVPAKSTGATQISSNPVAPGAAKSAPQKRPLSQNTGGLNKIRPPVLKAKPPVKKPTETIASHETKKPEYDLNDPTLWDALFGSGDKKPAAKPIKPGNLPPRATLHGGSHSERMAARAKQRAEEKRLLEEQSRVGFDLLRQNSEMMEFEIEYKNHVRYLVDQPLPDDYRISSDSQSSPWSNMAPAHWQALYPPPQPYSGSVMLDNKPDSGYRPADSVMVRSGGYKKYLQPPPHSQPPLAAPSVNSQMPGPCYYSVMGPVERRKVLPRPGMFGSSFYIWQMPHVP